MSLPIIGPDQDFAVWAVLIGLAAFGFWCERYPFGRKYSGVLLLISAAILLSNLRIIPTSAPAYEAVWEYLVPVAIPLLLFQADMSRIIREAGQTLVAFILGAAAVVAGVVVAASVFDLGESEAQLAGVFAGTYIGGSLNFAAVAEATGFRDSSLLAATVAADNLITNLHFILIIMLPGIAWLARQYPQRGTEGSDQPLSGIDDSVHRIADLGVAGLLSALSLAFALAALGKALAALAGYPQFAILITTLLALLVASLFPRQVERLSGYREAGNVLMFIFLASIGASADIWVMMENAPQLFVFALTITGIHLVLLLVVGRLLRLGLAEMIMASAVCVGGPASAGAIASAKGWRDLLIPGVLAGSLGYAIGSFVGVSIVAWMS
jgi:uncharacterized membrane protein